MGLKINKTSQDYENNFDGLEGKSEEQREIQDDSLMLLNKIVKELKIMNFHLSILTDTTIKRTEVE